MSPDSTNDLRITRREVAELAAVSVKSGLLGPVALRPRRLLDLRLERTRTEGGR